MAEQDHTVDPSLIRVTIGTIIFMVATGFIITSALNG